MGKEELLVTAEDELFPGFSNQCLGINKKGDLDRKGF